MGYFDSIKENTALSAPEKKAAFNKQLGENKRSVYPNLILVMLSALGYTKRPQKILCNRRSSTV